jgi:hypothetical protein
VNSHRSRLLLTHARSGFTWGTTVPDIAHTPEEPAVFEESHHDAIVRRGLDEALACRDLLTPAPPRPSLLARLLGRWAAHTQARTKPLVEATSARESAVAPVPKSARL